MPSPRAAYWRDYKRAHPQAPRDRSAYYANYHAERREARNEARRRKYAGTRSRRAVTAYRARRAAEVEARLRAAVAAELERARAVPELAALIAEQERDARRYQYRRGPWALDGDGSAEWVA